MFLWAPFPILCWVNAAITDWVGLVGFSNKIHLVGVRIGLCFGVKYLDSPPQTRLEMSPYLLSHLCDTKVETQTAVTGIKAESVKGEKSNSV